MIIMVVWLLRLTDSMCAGEDELLIHSLNLQKNQLQSQKSGSAVFKLHEGWSLAH